MKNKIIYALTKEDVQIVAQQELGRDLSFQEVERITETIAEKIKWYDAIADSIYEKIELKDTSLK